MMAHLVDRGVDVFRLNFSHGSHEKHAERLEHIRTIEDRVGRPIGVFADLQGPKLRIGRFTDESITLETDDCFRLDLSNEPGDTARAPLPHPEVFAVLRPGAILLLDDGKVQLEVTSCGRDYADTRVVTGGRLSNNKGLNLPGTTLGLSPITEKDRRDLHFALEIGIGLIALSFVQRPEDVEEAKRLIDGRAHLIAKVEKPSAVERLDEIVDLADAIMIARGDLGIELPAETVPRIQKRIVHACRQAGKPVIVATQMLDSMVTMPTPTRADVSDVANAVYEGADAVMLSAETAVGDYPTRVIEMTDRIIRQTEADPLFGEMLEAGRPSPRPTPADTISESARAAAETLNASAIVTFTTSGATAARAAQRRPNVPIIALTPSRPVARSLSLVWGIHAVVVKSMSDYEEMEATAIEIATQAGFGRKGDHLVLTAGLPLQKSGDTNIMRLLRLDS
jgi:pyruvate kinase